MNETAEMDLDRILIRLIEQGHGFAAVPVIEDAVARILATLPPGDGSFELDDLYAVLHETGRGDVVERIDGAIRDLRARAAPRPPRRRPRRDAEERASWIFCAGMMRSGSTLQYQLVEQLLVRTGSGRGIWYATPQDFPAIYEEHRHEETTFVVKCHNFLPEVADLVAAGRARVLYTFRDLRDVVVSYMRVEKKSFEQVANEGFIEQRLEDDLHWYALDAVHRMRYEDWVGDLEGECLRIGAFLGIDVPADLARGLAAEFAFEEQKRRLPEFENRIMYPEHLHSGRAGQWRDALAPAELGFLESWVGEWLVARGYPLSRRPSLRPGIAVGSGQIKDGIRRRPLIGVYRTRGRITDSDRERMLGYRPFAVWLAGRSEAELEAATHAVERALVRRGCLGYALGTAEIDRHLDVDPAGTGLDAVARVRHAAELARVLMKSGSIVVTAVAADEDTARDAARDILAPDDLVVVPLTELSADLAAGPLDAERVADELVACLVDKGYLPAWPGEHDDGGEG